MISADRANAVQIEWDEDGCSLVIETDDEVYGFVLLNPEQAFDSVKAGILPWLMEGEAVKAEFGATRERSTA